MNGRARILRSSVQSVDLTVCNHNFLVDDKVLHFGRPPNELVPTAHGCQRRQRVQDQCHHHYRQDEGEQVPLGQRVRGHSNCCGLRITLGAVSNQLTSSLSPLCVCLNFLKRVLNLWEAPYRGDPAMRSLRLLISACTL